MKTAGYVCFSVVQNTVHPCPWEVKWIASGRKPPGEVRERSTTRREVDDHESDHQHPHRAGKDDCSVEEEARRGHPIG